MEIRHTLELGAENPILQMIKFSSRKIEKWIDCESCEGHRNDETIFTRRTKTKKKERRLYIFLFLYYFMLNREISICMVSLFFNTGVFRSFYPRDYIHTFIY